MTSEILEVAGFPESLSVSEVFLCVSIAISFFAFEKPRKNHYALLLLSMMYFFA